MAGGDIVSVALMVYFGLVYFGLVYSGMVYSRLVEAVMVGSGDSSRRTSALGVRLQRGSQVSREGGPEPRARDAVEEGAVSLFSVCTPWCVNLLGFFLMMMQRCGESVFFAAKILV